MKKGSLQPKDYIPRIIDRQVSELLDLFGAVEIAGTMWCGKTWTSMAFAESITHIGTETSRMAAQSDPSVALLGTQPHVIDEWQDVPAIWDEVRSMVDKNNGKAGQYILTGSSDPQKELVHHSGAGRIARVRMSTMTLQETGESNGKVSLAGLFNGEFEPVPVQQKLAPLAEIICRGCWPQIIQKKMNSRQSVRYLDSYFDALFDITVPKKRLNSTEARNTARALARNIGAATAFSTLAEDAGFTQIEKKTATAKIALYVQLLQDLYVINGVTGWDAPIRSKTRLRTKPKYYFSDPSMAANLLGISPERLLTDGQTFGCLFESLCMHDLAVYSSVLPKASSDPLHYYRDADGLETDAVIELRDGRWAAFEIKLGENKVKEGSENLHRLKKKIGLNPAARNPKPEFLAVITGACEAARFDREHDVYVLPITALGA